MFMRTCWLMVLSSSSSFLIFCLAVLSSVERRCWSLVGRWRPPHPRALSCLSASEWSLPLPTPTLGAPALLLWHCSPLGSSLPTQALLPPAASSHLLAAFPQFLGHIICQSCFQGCYSFIRFLLFFLLFLGIRALSRGGPRARFSFVVQAP